MFTFLTKQILRRIIVISTALAGTILIYPNAPWYDEGLTDSFLFVQGLVFFGLYMWAEHDR